MNVLLAHINYFEQGQELSYACRRAAEIGVDGIEFRRKPMDYAGSDLDYLDKLSAALDRYPLDCVSFGGPGPNLMAADEAQRVNEIESAEKFFRKAASRFPLRVVNAFAGNLLNPDRSFPGHESWRHGSAVASESQWESAIAGYKYLAVLAESLKIHFAFETHGCYLHDTLEATLRLVRSIDSPRVGVLWDHANLALFPDVPTFEEVIRDSAGRLFYVHLKNWMVPPSQFPAISSLSGGILNIRDQYLQLCKADYKGPFCLESPRAGDREQFLREDVAYFRSLSGQS